jgi:Zn-dependent protease
VFDSFGTGGLRFHLFGFPVRVDPSFWIVAVLLGLGLQDPAAVAIWVAVVFVSILAHELGHAFMGRAFGIYGDIELYSMGGVTKWFASRAVLRPTQQIAISLAGPCTGLAIGAGVWAAFEARGWPDVYYWRLTIFELLWVNFGWGLLNLLPILPLDGGHVCQSAIHWIRGYRDDGLPLLISVVFGAAAGVAALLVGMFWGALLALWFTIGSGAALRQQGPLRLRDVPWALLAALVAGAGLLALMRFTGRI